MRTARIWKPSDEQPHDFQRRTWAVICSPRRVDRHATRVDLASRGTVSQLPDDPGNDVRNGPPRVDDQVSGPVEGG